MVKDTTISFISKAIDIHGDYYDYSLVEYVNNATKVVKTTLPTAVSFK